MTKEEITKAVDNLKKIRKQFNKYEFTHSIDLAIDALEGQEQPTGKWITVHYAREELNCPEKSMLDFVKCPFCETIHQGRHNFCSRCGAKMKKEAERCGNEE